MGVKLLNYVLMFFLYSIIGWTVESTYRSLGETVRARKTTKEKKIINSGFLYGPLCPIYGTGALVFEILLTPFQKHWWAVVLLGMVFADIVEYITSVLMEKLFHARWWDYSHEFLNLHGRICLKHTIYWAIFSTLYIYAIRPVYEYMIDFIPQNVRNIMVIVILAVFSVDLLLTVRAALGVNKIVTKMESLRTTLTQAGDYVRAAAGSLKGSTLAKYDEFRDTVAATPERFEAWKADVSNQIRSVRAQLDALTAKKPKDGDARVRRFLSISPGISEKVNKLVKDLEDRWEELKTKYGSEKDGDGENDGNGKD